MEFVADTGALEALYGTPGEAARLKVARRLTRAYGVWIARARLSRKR